MPTPAQTSYSEKWFWGRTKIASGPLWHLYQYLDILFKETMMKRKDSVKFWAFWKVEACICLRAEYCTDRALWNWEARTPLAPAVSLDSSGRELHAKQPEHASHTGCDSLDGLFSLQLFLSRKFSTRYQKWGFHQRLCSNSQQAPIRSEPNG